MARIDTVRPDAGAPRAMNDIGSPVALPAGPPPGPTLAAFREGRSEADRTVDLLAFAMAAERGRATTPDTLERARRDADAALGDYSLRYVHNNVEQLRHEAITAHLGRIRQPPGFVRLVLANLVALAIAGGAAAWLYMRPDLWTAFAGLVGG